MMIVNLQFTHFDTNTVALASPTTAPSINPTVVHHDPKVNPKTKPKSKNSDRESKHYEWWQGAKRYVGYQYQSRSPKRKDDKN